MCVWGVSYRRDAYYLVDMLEFWYHDHLRNELALYAAK